MKKTLIALVAFSALALAPARASAQTVGGSAWYDFQARSFTPVVTTKIAVLPDFLGNKSLRPELRAFAGVQNARGLVGTAIVFSGPLAQNATWDLGLGARSSTGSRGFAVGIIAGVSFKF